jgi:hypothetical protein
VYGAYLQSSFFILANKKKKRNLTLEIYFVYLLHLAQVTAPRSHIPETNAWGPGDQLILSMYMEYFMRSLPSVCPKIFVFSAMNVPPRFTIGLWNKSPERSPNLTTRKINHCYGGKLFLVGIYFLPLKREEKTKRERERETKPPPPVRH